MRHLILALALISMVSLIGLATSAQAASLYVYPDGSGTHATIQAAVDASQPGDDIWLMPGVFQGPGNRDITINHDLRIAGSATTDDIEIIIDVEGSAHEFHRAFTCVASHVVFEDLGIINGFEARGGAIHIEEGYVTCDRCLFQNNEADLAGGAAYVTEEAVAIFGHCMFGGNVAADEGGVCYATVESEIQLTYCSLVANGAAEGSAVYLTSSSICDIERSIIAFGHGGAACQTGAAGTFTAWTTDVYHNAGGDWTNGLAGLEGGTNNSSIDPLFVDPMGEPANYELTHDSPCGTPYPGGLIGARMMDISCDTPTYSVATGSRGMFRDLETAVADAPAGAVIALEAGTHQGPGYQDVAWTDKDLVVRGRTGDPEDCIIDIGGSEDDEHRALTVTGLTSASVLEGLTLRGGWAEDGGALQINGPSALGLMSCTFIDNVSSGSGGAVQGDAWTYDLEACRFEGNRTIDHGGSGGGGLFLTESAGTMAHCDFLNNNSGTSFYGGGGVVIHSRETDGTTTFLRCEFIDNEGDSYDGFGGGGVCLRHDGCATDAVFTECTLRDNHSTRNGGAVYFRNNEGSITFENCVVTGNGALLEGGGVSARCAEAVFSETEVTDNDARSREAGGVMISSADLVNVSECRFENNESECAEGGAIYLDDVQDTEFVDTSFVANQAAGHGAAVRVRGRQASFSWCRFQDNITDSVGSALYAYSSGGTAGFNLADCVISGNTAGTSASVISSEPTSVHPCTFDLVRCTIHGNATCLTNGRAFNLQSIDTLNVSQSLITSNAASWLICGYVADPPTTSFSCTNIYGNSMGDWASYFAGQLNDNGNMCAYPHYCDAPGDVYTVRSNSPCLPENNECGVQIGARGQGCEAPVGVDDDVPATALTCRNYPNPFNPQTTIAFDLPVAGPVQLDVLDAAGRRVRTLLAATTLDAGRHTTVWDGRDQASRPLGSGVYLARVTAGGQSTVQRMLMLK